MTEEQLNSERDVLSDMLTNSINELNKYFDSIIILATRSDNNGETTYCGESRGNYYANYGVIKMWLDKQTLNGEIE